MSDLTKRLRRQISGNVDIDEIVGADEALAEIERLTERCMHLEGMAHSAYTGGYNDGKGTALAEIERLRAIVEQCVGAGKFILACQNDPSAAETGAWADAHEWAKNACIEAAGAAAGGGTQ